MEDVQQEQQTRVVIVNGQTIIVQGDTTEHLNYIKVGGDVLQEALHDADERYSSGNAISHENNPDEFSNLSLLGPSCVAIYEGEGGEAQTIQLTAEHCKALGIELIEEINKHELSKAQIDVGANGLQFKDDHSQIIYSEDVGHNEGEVMFETQVSEQNSVQESMEVDEGNAQLIETPQENLDTLLGDGTVTSNQQITLVPQIINGQMRYLVEVQGTNQDSNTEQFADIDVPSPVKDISCTSELQQQRITFHNITSVSATSSPSAFTPISTSLPTTLQTINNYQCSRTTPSNATLLLSKIAKLKQVVPAQPFISNVSTAASVTNSVPTTVPLRMIKKPTISVLQQTPTSMHVVQKPILCKTNTANSLNIKSKNESVPFFTKVPENVSTARLSVVSQSAKAVSTASTTSRSPSIITTTGSKVIRVLGEKGVKTFQSVGVPITTPLKKVVTSDGKLVSTSVATVDSQKTLTGQGQTLLTKRMPVSKFNKAKPLGSSENPIQLVQHGQTFHSVQTLNQNQLKQIATVLQEKIYDKTTRHNTIYNAETNTRIIYRVVYPEDLEQKDSRMKLLTPAVRGRGKRGRPPKSARLGLGRGTAPPDAGGGSSLSLDGEDEDRLEDSNKGERKKIVARTRSGRVSRPPRHMVKDYKRLHRLDFEEPDLDDSDGGYSDYTPADQDNEDSQDNKNEDNKLLPGLMSTRRRKISSHFRCPTCQKIYLGHARMSRHFIAFPDHGSIDQLAVENKDGKADVATEDITDIKKITTTPGRGRGKRRGPWAYCTPEARAERRKLKLREALSPCEADELSEVAGPAVAGILSLWELLLLRVESVRTQESYVATLCDELGALLEKIRSVSGKILTPISVENPRTGHIELQDEAVCTALGISCGRYAVDDRPLRPPMKVNSNKRVKLEMDNESNGSVSKSDGLDDSKDITTVTLDKCDSAAKEEPRTKDVNSSPTKTIDRELLLPSDSEICSAAPNGPNSTHDLQIVDEIVNERLKNLTGGNGLDYVLSVPIPINRDGSAHEELPNTQLINSLEHFDGNKVKSVWDKEKFGTEMELGEMDTGAKCQETQKRSRLNDKLESSFNSDLGLPESGISEEDAYDCQTALQGMEESEQTRDNLQFRRGLKSESTYHGNDEEEFSALQESIVGGEEDSFDPEITIAAMGGGTIQVQTNDNFDPGEDPIQFQNNSNVSNGSFDPEMALAGISEANQQEASSKPSTDQHNALSGSRTFPGLGLVDVSLDESGPELDFEALSEEFNRNTSHTS